MKKFTKIIKNCIQCPNYEKYVNCNGDKRYICQLADKIIYDVMPNWCPLEDADDTKAKDKNSKTVILNGLE